MARKDLLFTRKVRVQEDDGFVVLDETRPGTVAILPFKETSAGYQALARYEPMPSTGFEYRLCCLTGGMEEGEDPHNAALRELFEESGFQIESLIHLGSAYSSKMWARPVFLFAADVTGKAAGKPPGDGSLLESLSTTAWVDLEDAHGVGDTLFLACLCRLRTLL